jgi:hypothetical protein
MPRPTDYVTLNVTGESRDALRALSAVLSGDTRRRVNLSVALAVACKLAEHHRDEATTLAVAALTTDAPPTTDAPTTPTREDTDT